MAVYCYWLARPPLQNAFCQQNVSELGISKLGCCRRVGFLEVPCRRTGVAVPSSNWKCCTGRRITWRSDLPEMLRVLRGFSFLVRAVNISCPCFVACQRLDFWLPKFCSVWSVWKISCYWTQTAFMWKGNMAVYTVHDIALKGVIKICANSVFDIFSTLLGSDFFLWFSKKLHILFSIASVGTTGRNWCSYGHLPQPGWKRAENLAIPGRLWRCNPIAETSG